MFGVLPTKHSRSFAPNSPDACLQEKEDGIESQWKRIDKTVDAPAGISRSRSGLLIVAWIFTSNATVLMNAHMLRDFPHPTTLTAVHLASFTLLTQVLARNPSTSGLFGGTTQPSGYRNIHSSMPRHVYMHTILPIGLLYTGSLVCSNSAYLTLGVGFIQMLKSLGSATVLLASVSLGLKTFSWPLAVNMSIIIFGVMLTAAGTMSFAWSGLMLQLAGTVCEAYRLGLTEKLINEPAKGTKEPIERMTPMLLLFYVAPVCAAFTAVLALFLDLPRMRLNGWSEVGFTMFATSAVIAFALNLASMMVISATSSLTLTVCGVLKNALLVVGSVFFFGEKVTGLQVFGYLVATGGLVLYSLDVDLVAVASTWTMSSAGMTHLRRAGENEKAVPVWQCPRVTRKQVIAALTALVIIFGGVSGFWTSMSREIFQQNPGELTLKQREARAQRMIADYHKAWLEYAKKQYPYR